MKLHQTKSFLCTGQGNIVLHRSHSFTRTVQACRSHMDRGCLNKTIHLNVSRTRTRLITFILFNLHSVNKNVSICKNDEKCNYTQCSSLHIVWREGCSSLASPRQQYASGHNIDKYIGFPNVPIDMSIAASKHCSVRVRTWACPLSNGLCNVWDNHALRKKGVSAAVT